jgi:hypothetical protein
MAEQQEHHQDTELFEGLSLVVAMLMEHCVVESRVDDPKCRNSGGANFLPGRDSTRKKQGRV